MEYLCTSLSQLPRLKVKLISKYDMPRHFIYVLTHPLAPRRSGHGCTTPLVFVCRERHETMQVILI
jgi:hypothetical protein